MRITTYNTASNKSLYVYYVMLLLVMTAWTDQQNSPPQILRFLFLSALVLPLFIYKNSWTPVVFSLFFIVSNNSFASSVLPTDEIIYYFLLVILAQQRKRKNCLDFIPIALFLFVYIYFVNSITNNTIELAYLYLSLFFLFVFSYFIRKTDIKYPHFFSYAFILSSLILSLLFIIFGDQFATEKLGGFEKYTWKDTNYFCGVLSMGVVASLFEVFYPINTKRLNKYFLLSVILVNLFVILQSASRGALSDVAIAFIILFSFTSASKRIKIFVALGVLLAVSIMYQFGTLDFMIFRWTAEESDEIGNGRIVIWMAKLFFFFHGTPLHQLFGYGCEGGRVIGVDNVASYYGLVSTHNDFLSFLVYYGYIGFLSFLVLLFKPIIKPNNKPIVISGTAFLVTSCFTIEPFAGGNIAWYAFLFYIYIWSQIPNERIKNRRN